MAKIGLVDSIYEAAAGIDAGRKGFAILGKEREGRVLFEDSIAKALTTFQQAQISADPQALILAEFTFLSQELQLCEATDKDSKESLTKAIESFDDAFLALQAVDDPRYAIMDNGFPHNGKFRVKGFPKDSYHIAFIAHRTRLKNILRAPGIRPSADCVRVRKSPFETAACKSDNCTERVFGKAEEGS